jgi:hypothetical protein
MFTADCAIDEMVDCTRDEAEAEVRRIICVGGIIHSGRFSCGPFRAATVRGPRWAIVVQTGEGDDFVRDDWWPVAVAFVARVGKLAAAQACREYRTRHPEA